MNSADNEPRIALIAPTYNVNENWEGWLEAVKRQKVQPDIRLLIDSSSEDDTVYEAKQYGFKIYRIAKDEFNHGGTRQLALEKTKNADVAVYLTQDAILANEHSLENIIHIFKNPKIGAAYGRQLPYNDADPIEKHARLFNYPSHSRLDKATDIEKLGIRAAFISNSFAAYRVEALTEIGGFPKEIIRSEDMYVGAKLLSNGWDIAYCAEAQVYHSHNYTTLNLFRRHFENGVFHARERWIRKQFGNAEDEGIKCVLSEIRYLASTAPKYIPKAILYNAIKYCAYRLGLIERFIPTRFKIVMGNDRQFWARSTQHDLEHSRY